MPVCAYRVLPRPRKIEEGRVGVEGPRNLGVVHAASLFP
jgi:hypothetical protein